jgi:hypothetical protein
MVVADDYDRRIRGGLRFISTANRLILQAARQLEKAIRDEVFGGIKIQAYEFVINGTRYSGKLTDEQHQLLKEKQGAKDVFADAVSHLVGKVAEPTIAAEENLLAALRPVPRPTAHHGTKTAGKTRPRRVSPKEYGTCDYDTGKEALCVTRYVCVSAYSGTWTADGC